MSASEFRTFDGYRLEWCPLCEVDAPDSPECDECSERATMAAREVSAGIMADHSHYCLSHAIERAS